MVLLLAVVALGQAKMSLQSRFEPGTALPGISPVVIDGFLDGMGVAQPLARNRGIQARILWIDATANIDRYNSDAKVAALVDKVKSVGFNTVVFDIKPISGQVVYKSAIAPKLEVWRDKRLPIDYDPLAAMCRETKRVGLSLIVSLNAFSEGHRLFKVGPGYELPEHQTVIYEPKPVVVVGSERFPLAAKLDVLESNAVSVFTSAARVPSGGTVVTVRKNGVMDRISNVATAPPAGGVTMFGSGTAGEFLRRQASVGQRVAFDTEATFLPMAQSQATQYPLMMNPNDPEVRSRELAILREVATRYPVDGMVFDDRLRYAGIDADFSEVTRQQFEAVVAQKLNWPDDVFKFTVTQNLTRGVRPGRFYDQWMAWRAAKVTDFLGEVRRTITAARPGIRLGMYVGSWYGEYAPLGNNYASPKAEPAFWFTSRNYRRSGDAHLVDFVIPGCYYTTATIHEAMSKGLNIGSTVEASAHLAYRLVRDEAWTYAGLSLIDFKGDPDGLANALQAACSATQGVMVFDLSHDIEPMWPVFARAFAQPARPPHMTSLLADVRRTRASLDRMGVKPPPITIASGSAGTGQ
ncbi:family 10 glycosylhydrolase [Fimbriimonas ginsengisoli]|uniref:S-layer related protein, sialic acid-specific 9-O-acetylesterase n=1 Tax=Fimbriimonas ginsengisoli Gsoil 348 TaxID=661478 RepID=A0A068NX65_FIMGI|nr:family 10 glycosylhydrolase [Fimbriimonas ginsengisoli]AIE87947.1 S-layer related protein precursor, sialic acid-specific 9-O-acetylesterase [Fimbriimonas ginsengisoli Gsoil 348]